MYSIRELTVMQDLRLAFPIMDESGEIIIYFKVQIVARTNPELRTAVRQYLENSQVSKRLAKVNPGPVAPGAILAVSRVPSSTKANCSEAYYRHSKRDEIRFGQRPVSLISLHR